MIRRIGIFASLFIAVLVLAWIVFVQVVDADFVETRVNAALAKSDTSVYYQASIGQVKLNLFSRSVELRAVALEQVENSNTDTVLTEIRADRLAVSRLRLLPLLRKRHVRARTFEIENPSIVVPRKAADEEEPMDPEQKLDSLYARIVAGVGPLSLKHLQIKNAAFTFRDGTGDELESGVTIDSIFVEVDDILISQEAAKDTSRLFFGKAWRLQVHPHQFVTEDSLYAIETGHLKASSADSIFIVDGLQVQPLVSDAEFTSRIAFRRDRFDFSMSGLHVNGLDFTGLLKESVVARQISIDSFFVDVYKDKRVPRDPNRPAPPIVQHAFQSIPLHLQLDTLTAARGTIKYREVEEDGVHPGEVSFEQVAIQAHHISNADSLEASRWFTHVSAEAQLMGEGPLTVDFRVPLMASTFDIHYWGTLGSMSGRSISPLLKNLQGIMIESGEIDGMRFDVKVADAIAAGEIELAYHDLDMKFMDKVDRSRNLGHRLKTFFISEIIIHPHNPGAEGEPLRIGKTAYEMDADPFFRFFWRSIRDGIKDTIGKV